MLARLAAVWGVALMLSHLSSTLQGTTAFQGHEQHRYRSSVGGFGPEHKRLWGIINSNDSGISILSYLCGVCPGGIRFAVPQPFKDAPCRGSVEVQTRRAQAQPEIVKMATDTRAVLGTLPLLGWLLRSPEEDEAVVRRSQAVTDAPADAAAAAAGASAPAPLSALDLTDAPVLGNTFQVTPSRDRWIPRMKSQ